MYVRGKGTKHILIGASGKELDGLWKNHESQTKREGNGMAKFGLIKPKPFAGVPESLLPNLRHNHLFLGPLSHHGDCLLQTVEFRQTNAAPRSAGLFITLNASESLKII